MALQCTQAERDALAAAIKKGVQSVAYADKSVRYASIDDMRKILAEMDEYLNGSSAATSSWSRAAFSRD